MPFACLDSNVWHPWIWVMLWLRSLGLVACLYQRECLFSILLPLCPALGAVLLLQTPLLCGPLLLKGCSAGSWCVCTPVVVQEAEVAPARFPLWSHWAGALCCNGTVRKQKYCLLCCAQKPHNTTKNRWNWVAWLIESPALIALCGQSYSA